MIDLEIDLIYPVKELEIILKSFYPIIVKATLLCILPVCKITNIKGHWKFVHYSDWDLDVEKSNGALKNDWYT